MSWKLVENYLHTNLISVISDNKIKDIAKDWLSQLPLNQNGIHLGLCIAIDIKSGSILATTFGKIFNFLEPKIDEPNSSFANACKKYNEKNPILGLSRYKQSVSQDHCEYARIITAAKFMQFYSPFFGVAPQNPFNPDDNFRSSTWEDFKLLNVTDNRIKDVEIFDYVDYLGWLFPYSDYIDAKNDDSELAHILADKLGLSHYQSLNETLICLKYPEDTASLVDLIQPCTLDIDWQYNDVFFLSYFGFDCWGRTCSCSGNHKPVKERIHFKSKSKKYLIEIDEIDANLNLDINKKSLIVQGHQRFNDAVPLLN